MKTDHHILPSPKRDRSSSAGRAGWYPYYAGFSAGFAGAVMDRYCTTRMTRVLDSWNGSGTTTAVAAGRGVESFGFDLNPVMSVVARARLLNKRERSSLVPLARTILRPHADSSPLDTKSDALAAWFKPSSVSAIRDIESGIQLSLLEVANWTPMVKYMLSRDFSDIASFFYVALFRTVRNLLSGLQSSNPTWMRVPTSRVSRLNPSAETVRQAFLANVQQMEQALDLDPFEKDGKVQIGVAPSSHVPVVSESVDFVLTSPPYCTRIDYAAATRVELAVLGIAEGEPFESLRHQLLGTPTVPRMAPDSQPSWGDTCCTFLDAVKSHPSRASATYYYKGLCQYFAGMYVSMKELQRCLRRSGCACLVVQDSFYKDIHIDLAAICNQMGKQMGLDLTFRQDFPQTRNLAEVNPRSKAYRTHTQAIESVLVFTKN